MYINQQIFNSSHLSLCFGAFSLCWDTSNCIPLPPYFPSSLHLPVTPPNFPGAFKARGMTSGPVVRTGPVAGVSLPETSTPYFSPSGSNLAPPSTFGAANPSGENPLFLLPSHTMGVCHSSLNMHQVTPPGLGTGMVQSVSMGGSPQMGLNMNPPFGGVGMVQSGSLVADPLFLGTGMGQSSFFGAGVAHLGGPTPPAGGGVPFQQQLLSGSGVGDTGNQNNNPFLFM